MPDGTPFDIPADSPMPGADRRAGTAAGADLPGCRMPVAAPNTREVDERDADSASRFIAAAETFIDSTSALRIEEEIDVAYPRLRFELRKTAKPGYIGLGDRARSSRSATRRSSSTRNSSPPMLICSAHPVVDGWIDRVDRLDRQQARGAGPLCRRSDRRRRPAKRRLFRAATAQPAHPGAEASSARRATSIRSGCIEEFLRLAGELATFATPERRAREYPAYDHDDLENVFAPLMRDIQDFLSARLGRRAIRLEIIERAQNAFVSTIRDRALFRNATFVLEVAARRPLIEIQNQFPHLFKVGPNTKMNEIVHAHLPGVPLVHLPTPPPQIRAITDHVYFYLDRKSPLWPEFSTASSIGMHFSGDWPELSSSSGRFWRIGDERQGPSARSVRPRRADDHPAESRAARLAAAPRTRAVAAPAPAAAAAASVATYPRRRRRCRQRRRRRPSRRNGSRRRRRRKPRRSERRARR